MFSSTDPLPNGPLIDAANLNDWVDWLCRRDSALAGVVERHGPPPLFAREPGFSTLVQIILEQQVSLSSAAAVYSRLGAELGRVEPDRILSSGLAGLRASGITRQKADYIYGLAIVASQGRLGAALDYGADPLQVRAALEPLRGIGPWTLEVYLLMAVGAPDAWPTGDIALAEASRQILELEQRPGPRDLLALAEDWRPCRSVAARILWHHYLNRIGSRGRKDD